MHAMVKVMDDPPKLTSGKGIPVTGIRLVTAAMFMMAWIAIIAVNPPATSRPKGYLVFRAIRKPA